MITIIIIIIIIIIIKINNQFYCIKMEFQKTINSDNKDLLTKGSKFMINKKKNYSINEEIKINTPMLRSDLRDLIVLSIKHNTIV